MYKVNDTVLPEYYQKCTCFVSQKNLVNESQHTHFPILWALAYLMKEILEKMWIVSFWHIFHILHFKCNKTLNRRTDLWPQFLTWNRHIGHWHWTLDPMRNFFKIFLILCPVFINWVIITKIRTCILYNLTISAKRFSFNCINLFLNLVNFQNCNDR